MQSGPPWLPALGRTRAGVFVVDARQRIVLWNKGAERLLGHSAAQVLGKPCYQVIAGVRDGKAWCQSNCGVQRKLGCGALPSDVELLTRTQPGEPIWIGFSILAIPAGGEELAAHFMRDVTREKRNQHQLEAVLAALARAGATGAESHDTPPALRAFSPSPRSPGAALRLTRREADVLMLLSQGVASKAIAERMGISLLTVRKHVQNALGRLGMHSQVAAVVFALQNGIL